MKNHSTLQDRLKKYSASATALAAVAVGGQAQMIYTDIVPDVVLNTPGATYNVDLDANSAVDFMIGQMSIVYTSSAVDIAYNLIAPGAGSMNAVDIYTRSIIYSTNIGQVANPNLAGVLIDAGASWGSGSSHLIAWSGTYGVATSGGPIGAGDKYIAVRFNIGSMVHYGWIRIEVAADASSITIKDYAYGSPAGSSIYTGDAIGMEELQEANIVVVQQEHILRVDFGSLDGAKNVNLIDMVGNQIDAGQFNGTQGILDVLGFASGVYMLSVQCENGTVNRKIYIK